MSKGFSDGSKVNWCRDFSRPGMETDRPEQQKTQTHHSSTHSHPEISTDPCVVFFFTIEDVGCIQSLLLLLQYVHVEGGPVPHFIITVHHAPTGTDGVELHYESTNSKNKDTLKKCSEVPLHEDQDARQQIIILSSKFSQSTDSSWRRER